MEEYFQEAGWEGRDGLPAEVTMYIIHMTSFKQSMACKKRSNLQSRRGANKISSYSTLVILPLRGKMMVIIAVIITETLPSLNCACQLSHNPKLCLDVLLKVNYLQPPPPYLKSTETWFGFSYSERLGTSRSFVGNVSLSTGFSLELIDIAVENLEQLTSVNDTVSFLPVFREENARVIFEIAN